MKKHPKILERIKELKKQLVLLSRGREVNKRVAALKKRGKYYFMIGDYENALKDLNTAIQVKPRDHRLYYLRGKIFKKVGEYRRAETDFIKTTDLNRNSEKGLNALGLLFMDQKKIDNAISCFKKAVKLNPKFSEGHNNLGLVDLEDTEDYESSIVHFNDALAIDPKSYNVRINRARSYLFLRKYQESLDDITFSLTKLDKLLDSKESNFEEDPLLFNHLVEKQNEALLTLKYLNKAMKKSVYEKETTQSILKEVEEEFQEEYDQRIGRKRKREENEIIMCIDSNIISPLNSSTSTSTTTVIRKKRTTRGGRRRKRGGRMYSNNNRRRNKDPDYEDPSEEEEVEDINLLELVDMKLVDILSVDDQNNNSINNDDDDERGDANPRPHKKRKLD